MAATVSSTFSAAPAESRPARRQPGTGRPVGVRGAHALPGRLPQLAVVNADATINVRVGGHGPAVVLIHASATPATCGRRWPPSSRRTTPSSCPTARHGLVLAAAGGYDKWTQAGDIRAVLDKLGIDRADIVATTSHDGRVCLRGALSGQDKPPGRDGLAGARHPAVEPDRAPARVVALQLRRPGRRAPGRRPRAASTRPLLERVRRRPVEDRRSDPAATTPRSTPGPARSFRVRPVLAIGQKDEADNLKAMETKLAMPVLAIGAAKAFGANVAVVMRNAATNVQERVVPNAGHWLMEESARGDDRRGAGLPRSALSPAAAPSLRPPPLIGGCAVEAPTHCRVRLNAGTLDCK